MNRKGPIVVIEDDPDDQHLLSMIFNELKFENEVLFFSDGESALRYLTQGSISPFLILSDINLPRMNGFEVRSRLQEDFELGKQFIPYVFFTTSVNQRDVSIARNLGAQGFFLKPQRYEDFLNTVRTILAYWTMCYLPE